MPSMGWQVLGVDLNRSESAGTPLACIGRRRHLRKSPTFLKDKSIADQSMAPALGASTRETERSRSLSFPLLCSARGWNPSADLFVCAKDLFDEAKRGLPVLEA